MLPVITEEISKNVFEEVFADVAKWRKDMIYYLKDENPEINSAIIEAANKTNLDPKAIALGAYMSYLMIELAAKENDELLNYNE